MKRLSGLDASFLYLETPEQLLHVCGLLVLDPYHKGRSVDAQELKMRARPHLGGNDIDDQQLLQILMPASNRAILMRMLFHSPAGLVASSPLKRKDPSTLRASLSVSCGAAVCSAPAFLS